MAHVYLDRTEAGEYSVKVFAGMAAPKTKVFASYADAEAFAVSKMGRTGSVLDTTHMTPEQLAAHKAREAAARAVLAAESRHEA